MQDKFYPLGTVPQKETWIPGVHTPVVPDGYLV